MIVQNVEDGRQKIEDREQKNKSGRKFGNYTGNLPTKARQAGLEITSQSDAKQ
jgi:hypothetical protein